MQEAANAATSAAQHALKEAEEKRAWAEEARAKADEAVSKLNRQTQVQAAAVCHRDHVMPAFAPHSQTNVCVLAYVAYLHE